MTTRKFNLALVATTLLMLASMILPWTGKMMLGSLTLVDILFVINEPNVPDFRTLQWFNLIACSVLPAIGLSVFCVIAHFTNNDTPPRGYTLLCGLTPFVFLAIAMFYLSADDTGITGLFSALSGIVRLGIGVYVYLISAALLLALSVAYFVAGDAFLRKESSREEEDKDAYIYT